jgi:DNA-binding transcriptional MerR regulator/methylmalonyl-CoA mutase cobalamin-binding subunit
MSSRSHEDSLHPIASVERETGLSKDTLRAWERRYGFPQPERTVNGDRAYPADQLVKLRLIKRLVDQGMRPGKLVSKGIEEIRAMMETRELLAAADIPADDGNAALIGLLRLHRSDELKRALRQRLLKQGLQGFVCDTVAAMTPRVGAAWLKGEIDVTEEHLYTEVIQNLLRGAIASHPPSGQRPRVLLTTFPDESHSLGLLMAESMLTPEGATCVSIGPQTPITDIVHAARAGVFDIVGLSFSSAYPVRRAVKSLTELRKLLPFSIAIWAGGRVLAEYGGDIPGVQFVGEIRQTTESLAQWRREHFQ